MRYGKVYNQAFTAFPKNVGFNTGISAPRPDMVEGLEMPEFDPFLVRQQLGGATVPTSGTNAITLPHLAGEWKGPGKDMILVQAQAAYDGACMVYGRNKALSFLDSPDPTGHAFVSTFTTTVLFSTLLRTIHLNLKANSTIINILSLAPYLYQAMRISKKADGG